MFEIPVVIVRQRLDAHGLRRDCAAFPDQQLALNGPDLVPAFRRLAHHGDAGVLVGLELVERVNDESKFQNILQMPFWAGGDYSKPPGGVEARYVLWPAQSDGY